MNHPGPPAPSHSPRSTGDPQRRGWRPYLLREPAAIVPWLCAATSIGTLLLYLAGLVELAAGAKYLLLPGLVLMAWSVVQAARRGRHELLDRLWAGFWAGLVATFVYDLVRVPIAMAGVPVFKAISYFGTVFLAQPAPTFASEVAGWSYHLSNGLGFALMYALWVSRPAWWSAVLWGLALEGMMLLTPYAEVFGYKISRQYLAITIGAHVAYGLGLWAGLRFQNARAAWTGRWPWCRHATGAALLLVPLGLAAMAADFHVRHARKMPASPPDYVGAHLYTTWDVLEPDRLATLWIWRRFVDRQARFHFIPPFTRITRGHPLDVPDAEIRRTGIRSAAEVLIEKHGLGADQRLAELARMTHLAEITPWLTLSEPAAHHLMQELRATVGERGAEPTAVAAQRGLAWLDEWYDQRPSLKQR